MAYAFVGEITNDSVLFKQSVHASGRRMSLPKPIADYLKKGHGSQLRIEIRSGVRLISKVVTLESGTEILANGDPDLVRVMKPGTSLTLRAFR